MGPDDEILPTDADSTVETPATDPSPAPAAPAAPALQEPARPVSARDSVRAAFEKLSKEDGDEPKPGEPLKAAGQQRDPATGRFAKQGVSSPAAAPAAGQSEKPAVVLDGKSAVQGTQPAAPAPSGPPPGWSVKSKADWDNLKATFPHIAADIERRQQETESGLAALRDYKDLKPYAEMATRSGTTLSAVLQRYTTMEGTLRRDPVQGMMAVAHNVGLSKAQAAQLFAHLAGALGARPTAGPQSNGGQPSTGGSDQNDPLAEVIGPLIERAIGPVAQKLGTLETNLSQRQRADQNAHAQSVATAIEKFAADPNHRYFPELEETISRLFESGMVERTADAAGDLTKAYEMAAQLHPEVRETLVSERLKAKESEARAKADAARKAAVSLNGHPAGGAAAPSRPAPGTSVINSVRAAFNQLSSGV